ncbi:predicted protein [Postia placenta Mad-698-R]|nr:predicted protein [Postia placenta Mad-698-R]
MAFRASSFSEACRYARAYLHTVRGDLHVLWDRGDILIAPMPDVVDAYVEKYKDGERHDILEVIGKKKIHWYCVIPHPRLSGGARSRAKRAIRQGFTNAFHKLKFVPSNARPHFMIVNAAMKIMENKELWVKSLQEFYERVHLKVDASRVVEKFLRLNALWTAPPPGEAQLRRKQEHMLPMNFRTGVQRTPERSKDRKPEARRSNGEPYVSTLKSKVAQLAPTGPRCLLTHQDDKSIQGCHVIPRRTDKKLISTSTHLSTSSCACHWTNHLECAMVPFTNTALSPIATFPAQKQKLKNRAMGTYYFSVPITFYEMGTP